VSENQLKSEWITRNNQQKQAKLMLGSQRKEDSSNSKEIFKKAECSKLGMYSDLEET
jgi:hypothetical protein